MSIAPVRGPFGRLAAAAALLLLAACGQPAGKSAPSDAAPAAAPAPVAQDIHSYARPELARVTHVGLDLKPDFAARKIAGVATLDLQAGRDAKAVVLDTKDLTIRSVTRPDGKPLKWSLGQADAALGAPLTVELPAGVRRIAIAYETSPAAGALQWLAPEQTAGKKAPYLFTQGQSILTRTWIPTQDSPGIRQTYSARVTVPEGLRAVMSAEMKTPDGEPAQNGRTFRFEMKNPIPPYLIALAVGDIGFKAIGPRTGVYTEPAMLEAAASEFRDLEKMMAAAEKLYGPYRWGRYDLLILPPSFPFGGMENPRLTFATPTIVAGDRSLVSTVAHELAHSWSGNLVTNATWADFWLNEGFTTYFENRIMEALYGPERAAMLRTLGWQDLQRTIAELGGPGAPDTRLHVDLKGRDPDDGSTDIAYEKGANLLRTIEREAGRDRFDAWLRSYFERNAFKPMTTELFLADIRANLIKGDQGLERRLQLEDWIYKPGLPSNAVPPKSEAFAKVDAQAKAFLAGTPAAKLTTAGWSTQEWQHFLRGLPRKLSHAQLADLDRTFGLTGSGNGEIRFDWFELAIANRYDPAVPGIDRFLSGMGRRKFVEPLFKDLMAQGDWGRPIATRIYAKTRAGYHPVTASSVDKVVR